MSYLAAPGTFSKAPKAWGFEPEFAIIGKGLSGFRGTSKLIANDGRTYLDWVCGLGAILLGYGHPEFQEAIIDEVRRGIGFSLPSILEEEVAELLATYLHGEVPGFDKDGLLVRFAKTGSDATAMAIRLARAVTGQEYVVAFRGHYHGTQEGLVSRTPPAHGVLDGKFIERDWGDFSGLDLGFIAAVIFEYPVKDINPIFFSALREYCNDNNALLIADEVVTGLRFGLGGASGRYGAKPDLYCMGKALGNGMPISALVGRKEYMEWFCRNDPVFSSSTHWGEAASLAAAGFVLQNWRRDDVNWIYQIGQTLMDGLKDAGYNVVGHPPRSLMLFERLSQRAFFIQGMRKRGILINRPQFAALTHTAEDVKRTVTAAQEIKAEMDMYSDEDLSLVTENYLPEVLFSGR